MNYVEIERDDLAVEPWSWAHQRKLVSQPKPYAPPEPMSGPEHVAFIAKLGRGHWQEQAFYRRRSITELAAKAILATRRKG